VEDFLVAGSLVLLLGIDKVLDLIAKAVEGSTGSPGVDSVSQDRSGSGLFLESILKSNIEQPRSVGTLDLGCAVMEDQQSFLV
jgi:hypothetical protein